VSNLSAEPEVFRVVLEDLLRPVQAQGLMRCLMRHRPVDTEISGDQIASVRFEDLGTGDLLAAGKCMGVTHVTNGCYRLHPVEWNVGEAAGALAAFCLNHRVSPRAVRSAPILLADFQDTLLSMGVQLHWPAEIRTRVR
jgi:hypothetical protein